MLCRLHCAPSLCAALGFFLISCATAAQEPYATADLQAVPGTELVTLVAKEAPSSEIMRRDERLDKLMKNLVAKVSGESRKHDVARVSATIIDMGYTNDPLPIASFGSWQGDRQAYPASVVKLFYMGAAYVWQDQGKLSITPATQRDLKNMIGPSSNVATQRVLNKICGVSSGSALSSDEFAVFKRKREAVNEWLRTLGFTHTNANQATWDDTYSPRDKQLVTGSLDGEGPHIHQNLSTSNDVARFLLMLTQGRIGTPEDRKAMFDLMERDVVNRRRSGYRTIFQDSLPKGARLWGKSGFTSDTSHDAGVIISPGGRQFVLVVLAEVSWDNTPFLGRFAQEAVKGLESIDPRLQDDSVESR